MRTYLVVLVSILVLSSATPAVVGQGEPAEERLFLNGEVGCNTLVSIVNRCLAAFTGNAQITLQLIAEYALDVYTFLQNNVSITSLLEFLQIVEKSVDPLVSIAELRCECTKPSNDTAKFPWDCTPTSKNAGLILCDCKNADADSAFCDIRVNCPVNSVAVGGRCNNEIQYGNGEFHFDDVGFGIPMTAVPPTVTKFLPSYTRCNAEVSRQSVLSDNVDVYAYAYCKAL